MARSRPVPAARETGVVSGRAATLLFLHARIHNLILEKALMTRGELHSIIALRSSSLCEALGETRRLASTLASKLATSLVMVLEDDRSPQIEEDAAPRSQVEPHARVLVCDFRAVLLEGVCCPLEVFAVAAMRDLDL